MNISDKNYAYIYDAAASAANNKNSKCNHSHHHNSNKGNNNSSNISTIILTTKINSNNKKTFITHPISSTSVSLILAIGAISVVAILCLRLKYLASRLLEAATCFSLGDNYNVIIVINII